MFSEVRPVRGFESETAYWAARRATLEQIQQIDDIAHEFDLAARAPGTVRMASKYMRDHVSRDVKGIHISPHHCG